MTAGPDPGCQERPAHACRGIGLDAEQVERFEKFASGERPWRLVYSAREAAHLAAQPRAAHAFCAAFCCKEAFCKARGEPYSFPHFECLYVPGAAEQEIVLSPALREGLDGGAFRVNIDERWLAERGEFLVELYLIRPVDPQLETLRIAPVAAGRRQIEEEHFSPREIADLGRRAVQSLAGFLALKRALVRVWSGSGVAAAPRDFELGHFASGAPRLVAAPAGVALEDVHVSISHTRQWAYGLAALGQRRPAADKETA